MAYHSPVRSTNLSMPAGSTKEPPSVSGIMTKARGKLFSSRVPKQTITKSYCRQRYGLVTSISVSKVRQPLFLTNSLASSSVYRRWPRYAHCLDGTRRPGLCSQFPRSRRLPGGLEFHSGGAANTHYVYGYASFTSDLHPCL